MQVPPLAPTQVHVQVSLAGNVSAIVAPVALLGPALDAVIVYVTDPPGVALLTPSVFVIDRSADAPSASTSVAELLPGVGSVTPAGGATFAVFASDPVAAAEIEQLAVYEVLPPAGRLIVSLMLPAPDAVHVPPPAPTQVQVQVSLAGKVSVTVAAVALLGPALDAVIVYVTDPPAVALVTPSVFVIERSADAPSVSVSVAELLPAFGSETPDDTVAVLASEPVAVLAMVQVAV